MQTKDVILNLRTQKGLSQEALAEKVFVTRQAVSRWENGETIPNTETLKLLSKEFDISINTLLGSPRDLVCQCCGMPLKDTDISKETDGFFNALSIEELTDFLVNHMATEKWPADQARAYFEEKLPKLNYWKRYKDLGGDEKFEEFKRQLIHEFNDLHIEGMPEVKTLSFLIGGYINLEYALPNGKKIQFLDDDTTYLGYQLESTLGDHRCFGLAAGMDFLLVCTYDENGENPELVIYKKR